jgi:hypothetical protein
MLMKRVEAFIAAKKTDRVVPALEALNLQVIFYESKGMGKGEKYRLSYAYSI